MRKYVRWISEAILLETEDVLSYASCRSGQKNLRPFTGPGQMLRRAYDAKGGKSILGFRATARKGVVSRVVPRLSEGTIITTHRNDVHYLVTEFGVANLKGKSTRDRALAIIGIAAPSFGTTFCEKPRICTCFSLEG